MSDGWLVHESLGDAGAFHAADPAPIRSATFHSVATPTLVLGSAQHDTDVDARVADALGIAVVKRRSGGGAVLLIPDEFVWLDLVIPDGDALWDGDVARAMVWVGRLWQRALDDLGVATDVNHATGRETKWSRHVCFAGVGFGEVVYGQRKVVGVSQRRTRVAARFQSLCHLRWRPELVAALVAEPRPLATELANQVATIAAPTSAVCAALVRHLPAG